MRKAFVFRAGVAALRAFRALMLPITNEERARVERDWCIINVEMGE